LPLKFQPKWIILDGDLDANWIESMNSVMDDNKMLTLASNERIPLKPHMRLIFEIRDLRFATPATVSRAGKSLSALFDLIDFILRHSHRSFEFIKGILYISTDDGTQWHSLIQCWVQKLEGTEANKATLQDCFNRYVRPTLKWLQKHVSPVVSLPEMNFVQTLLFMLDGTLGRLNTSHTKCARKENNLLFFRRENNS
jgi:dynein heavy chain